jgi:hypothetical protein
MKRRDFLKTSAAIASVAAVGAPFVARTQGLDTVNVGHLVGICMSPLFYAKAQEYFREEGLNVEMKFMPNPGDALTALNSGAMDIIHNPFTNAFVAAGQGATVRIIAGIGPGGIFLVDQKATRINNIPDLAAIKQNRMERSLQHLELTLYAGWSRPASDTETMTSCGSTTPWRWQPRSNPRTSISRPMWSRSRLD